MQPRATTKNILETSKIIKPCQVLYRCVRVYASLHTGVFCSYAKEGFTTCAPWVSFRLHRYWVHKVFDSFSTFPYILHTGVLIFPGFFCTPERPEKNPWVQVWVWLVFLQQWQWPMMYFQTFSDNGVFTACTGVFSNGSLLFFATVMFFATVVRCCPVRCATVPDRSPVFFVWLVFFLQRRPRSSGGSR